MKKVTVLLSLLACSALLPLTACTFADKQNTVPPVIATVHNARNSLDWQGVYSGKIPAADGPGINVRITLRDDLTYTIQYQYIGRTEGDFTFAGTFKWNKDGNSITLDTENIPPHYFVGEGQLIQLDMEGKPITGKLATDYVLIKQS
jgi:uncharacterized lipoprotein NlpE involved in copper resistance